MPRPARSVPRRLAALTAGLAAATLTALTTTTAVAHAATPARLGHVFVVVLENKGYTEAYVTNPNPYLSRTLPAKGQLLTQYYGVAHNSLPNYLAMVAGQAPNAATQADCLDYVNVAPGTPAPDGQVAGQGCVYPRAVQTIADQLTARGLTWKAYLEDMGATPSREADRCGTPGNPFGTGTPDVTQQPTAEDQYAARHNPFVYFHSVLDSPSCNTNDVPLTALARDLQQAATTPNLSIITPDLCNDGHDATCKGPNAKGTNAGGLEAIDAWLQRHVPTILASPAYQQDGMLVVTADESDSPESDATACCNEPTGPNTPRPGINGPGGGRTGTVVLSACTTPGSRNATPYNHYALLRSLENVLGVTTGGADGHGHLGFAGQAGLKPFGADVFARCPSVAGSDTGGGATVTGSATRARAAGSLAATGAPVTLPLAALALLALAAVGLRGRRSARTHARKQANP